MRIFCVLTSLHEAHVMTPDIPINIKSFALLRHYQQVYAMDKLAFCFQVLGGLTCSKTFTLTGACVSVKKN